MIGAASHFSNLLGFTVTFLNKFPHAPPPSVGVNFLPMGLTAARIIEKGEMRREKETGTNLMDQHPSFRVKPSSLS